MNLQEQILRIRQLIENTQKNNYQIFVDMGNVLFPSSTADEITGKSNEKPTDTKKFQQWVLDTKKDTTILGTSGDDGKWGPKTQSAWNSYGQEYKTTYPSEITQIDNSKFIGSAIWEKIKPYDVYILTAIGNENQEQKKQFKLNQTRNILGLTNDKVIFVTTGSEKQNYSGANKILIDDSKQNIDAWVRKGGIGILHKNNEETVNQLNNILL